MSSRRSRNADGEGPWWGRDFFPNNPFNHPPSAAKNSEKPEMACGAAALGAGFSRAALAGSVMAGSGLSAGAAAGAVPDAVLSFAISSSSAVANWPINWAATDWIMPTPRPYWATEPDRVRSVSISTREPASFGSRRKPTTALAPPRPFGSRPWAFTWAVWALSSMFSKLASPSKVRDTGPRRTDTVPLKCRPSVTSVSVAPGMQGAMRSTSISTAQASAGGSDTSNELSNFTTVSPSKFRVLFRAKSAATPASATPRRAVPNVRPAYRGHRSRPRGIDRARRRSARGPGC